MPKKIALLILCLWLSACAPKLPPATQNLPTQTWRAEGVMGYNDAGKGFSTGYIWKNSSKTYNIQLIGALGAWRAELSGDAHQAKLAMSDGRVFTAKSPEKLMQENLAWSIPVENLRDWFCHEPNPRLPAVVQRKEGAVQQIQQSGWTIDYPDPSRIVLTQGAKKITVVVEHWERG